MTLPELAITLPAYPEDACFVVTDEKKITGVITFTAALKAVRKPRQDTTVAEIASQGYAVISADTSVFEILTKMRLDGTEVFLMAPGQRDDPADGYPALDLEGVDRGIVDRRDRALYRIANEKRQTRRSLAPPILCRGSGELVTALTTSPAKGIAAMRAPAADRAFPATAPIPARRARCRYRESFPALVAGFFAR